MSTTWTRDQVLALAPDAASAKAGTGLASLRKWSDLGCDDDALWGKCQGSGKDPYRTAIDLSEPAFKCTCPSRKFPCKHSIGLFLLLTTDRSSFTNGNRPDWVSEWIEGRAKRAEKRQTDNQTKENSDPTARARRAAGREEKVASGLSELEQWLRDLVRGGLAATTAQRYTYWDSIAARMVDAQAPGIARMLRQSVGIIASGEQWQERLLRHIAKIHLLVESYRRIDSLPTEIQSDIRTQIGWTQSSDDVLAADAVTDRWTVVGQRQEEEDRLRVQRTWLLGESTGRSALILSFAHGTQPLDVSLVPGSIVDADLTFYPGNYPLRALVRTRRETSSKGDGESVPGHDTIDSLFEAYAAALGRNLWLELFPASLRSVLPARDATGWHVIDSDGRTLPIDPGFDQGWTLMALGGGHPIAIFGEWDGERLLPLSARTADTFIRLYR